MLYFPAVAAARMCVVNERNKSSISNNAESEEEREGIIIIID